MDEQHLTSLTNPQSATAIALGTSAESMCLICDNSGVMLTSYHCSYGMNNLFDHLPRRLEIAP